MRAGLIKTQSKIAINLNVVKKQLNSIPQQGFDFFYKITPIRSGNARRRTTLRKNQINASYDYARRLDTGYSKQAPRGMSKPTLDFVRRLARKILGR